MFCRTKFLITLLFLISVSFSCGRAWKGLFVPEEGGVVIPRESEIVSIPASQGASIPEGIHWDFTLDKNDLPHIAIFDFYQGALYYFSLDFQGKWVPEKVDPPEEEKSYLVSSYVAGKSPRIFLVDGIPHIVYLSSSYKDKIPRTYLIKEAFKDTFGIWRCRTIKRWTTDIDFIDARYSPSLKKVILALLDKGEPALFIGKFSPGNENNTKVCNFPDLEERERENSDISLAPIYFFASGILRIKFKLDSRCNNISNISPGFSLQLLNFKRNLVDMTGFVFYEYVLNQAYWVEFRQDQFQFSEELSSQVISNPSLSYIEYLKLNESGTQCLPNSSPGYFINLTHPAADIDSISLLTQNGEIKLEKGNYIVDSPQRIFLNLSGIYPGKINSPDAVSSVVVKFKPMMDFRMVSLGGFRKLISAASDERGEIHFSNFNSTPPLFAVEYGFLPSPDSPPSILVVDGGGGGIYTVGTGGTSISVTPEGYPVIAYFYPFTSDLKVAVKFANTWYSVSKKMKDASGFAPKSLMLSNESSVAILVPTRSADSFKISLIYVAIAP